MSALGLSPNSFGLFMAKAAYSPEGAIWVDELIKYLDKTDKYLMVQFQLFRFRDNEIGRNVLAG